MKQDLADAAVLIDYLEHCDVYERAMLSHDVPPEVSPLHNAEASLLNTTKHHFLCPGNGFLAKRVVEMLGAIVGGKDKLRRSAAADLPDLPGEPAEAGAGLLRDHHGGGAGRTSGSTSCPWPWRGPRLRCTWRAPW